MASLALAAAANGRAALSFAFSPHHTTTGRQLTRAVFRAPGAANKGWREESTSASTLKATVGSQGDTTTASSSSERKEFDVIVIGGGHAGCEAAAAAARVGACTALVTQKLDTVGELSCNPSMGGIGKGHLVREIDALQGLMGHVSDQAGIHFRVLNQRKGPAVRGPRAQMDRDLYKHAMQAAIRSYPNLHLIQASADDLLLDESRSSSTLNSLAPFSSEASRDDNLPNNPESRAYQQQMMQSSAAVTADRKARIRGVVVKQDDGTTAELDARAVVITTGTFLRGVLLMGHERYAGGRHLRDSEKVEAPSIGLAQTLERFRFPLGRLKTGTPARVDGRTIDWDALTVQPSETPAQPFSHLLQFQGLPPPNVAAGRLIACHQTATNEETHKLVLQYEHTLPRYDGGLDGQGTGPRYCPSIYKKVQRFPERDRHNCFLEPEGLHTDLVYPNGMSGPYPPDVQQQILRTMKGLGAVEIVRPGYDVEYDFVNPSPSLTHTLETKAIGGLYLAGQICGTTGYEEAGAQGIVAGTNAGRTAAAAARGDKPPLPFCLGRDEAYIGVLIDDLVTRGTLEPYRMFTSRAEYRIQLRADNADLRLTRQAAAAGLITDPQRLEALEARESHIQQHCQRLQHFELKVTEWAARGDAALLAGPQMQKKASQKKTAHDVLSMPGLTLHQVEEIMVQVYKERQEQKAAQPPELAEEEYGDHAKEDDDDDDEFVPCPPYAYDTVEAAVKYRVYADRQVRDMDSWRKAQGLRIPPDLEYTRQVLPTFSSEELEKLNAVRPTTFAEASHISGMTPESLVYLYNFVQKRQRQRDARRGGKTQAAGAN